jgi:hypothetical protein
VRDVQEESEVRYGPSPASGKPAGLMWWRGFADRKAGKERAKPNMGVVQRCWPAVGGALITIRRVH